MSNIEDVVIMGSSWIGDGNITPYAEFNVYLDPESFKIVMQAPFEKTIFPMEPLEDWISLLLLNHEYNH